MPPRKYKRIRELAALIITRSYEGADAAIASLARQILERAEPIDLDDSITYPERKRVPVKLAITRRVKRSSIIDLGEETE